MGKQGFFFFFFFSLNCDNQVIVAHSGDSRAVLCRGGKAFPLTRDHKPQVRSESQRIIERGGFVRNGRVNGELALSRAIGDTDFQVSFNFEFPLSSFFLFALFSPLLLASLKFPSTIFAKKMIS